jgi:hypothetical protein
MRKTIYALAIAGVMAIGSGKAFATVSAYLYNNGGPDYSLTEAYSDSLNLNGTGPAAFTALAYSPFTLSDPTITGMEWWGDYTPGNTPPTTDAFSYDIQENTGAGNPPGPDVVSGSLGAGNRTDTGNTNASGLEIYEYSATGLDIPLAAGNYYLSIYDTVSNPGNTWAWANSTNTQTVYTYFDFPGLSFAEWGLPNDASGLAFNLTGEPGAAVPEPATMTLLGLGLTGLVAKFARRKNR